MRRRKFILAVASLAVPGPVAAQKIASKRIALVNVSAPSQANMSEERSTYYKTFLSELRRLGHTEGQNLVVDRYSKEQLGAGPEALAAQVASKNPDVILLTDPSTPGFVRESKDIPIVTIQ